MVEEKKAKKTVKKKEKIAKKAKKSLGFKEALAKIKAKMERRAKRTR